MKKSVTMILVLAMVLSCLQYAPQKAMAAEEYYVLENEQVVTFKNAASGWFMNLQHGTDENGTKLNVYPYDESPPYTQKYKVSLNADGSFKIAAVCAPTRFVDVRRYSKPLTEGQGIVIWGEDGDTNKHLRLKKVGDKVAIVFANNTNLCIAPSSKTAAQTTQKQMIVKKLDTSKSEMLWELCDAKGKPLDIDNVNVLSENGVCNFTPSLRVILSPACVEGATLICNDNGRVTYGMERNEKQFIYLEKCMMNDNSYFVKSYDNRYLCAKSLKNGGLVQFDKGLSELNEVSILNSKGAPIDLSDISNEDYVSIIFKNNYAFDVTDVGATDDHSTQLWQWSLANPAQMFRVTIINDEIPENRYFISDADGLYLDVKGGDYCEDNPVIGFSYHGGYNQTFSVKKYSNGYCRLFAGNSNLCLTRMGESYVLKKFDEALSTQFFAIVAINSREAYIKDDRGASLMFGADNEITASYTKHTLFKFISVSTSSESNRAKYVDALNEEYRKYGNRPRTELYNNCGRGYAYGSWCARMLHYIAKEQGLSAVIPSGKDSAQNLPEAIVKAGGKAWTSEDICNGIYTPKAGDVFVLAYVFSDSKTKPKYKPDMYWAHVGAIAGYDLATKTITSIEGNWSDMIQSKERQYKDANGYCGYYSKDGRYTHMYLRLIIEPNY